MARQLIFDLPVRDARGRGDFFVSASNATALAAVEGWQAWPGMKLVLTGPAGSGKSHLAQVWTALSGATIIAADRLADADLGALAGENLVIEDAERVAGNDAAERAAFHAHNLVLAEGGHLLVTAREAPSRWGLALPDLASRMLGTPVVAIEPPDEALLAAVLVKLFADRQLAAPPSLIGWLVPRIERSFAAAQKVVADLDSAALSQRRPLGQRLAAEIVGRED